MRRSNLTRANLTSAYLKEADLHGANLTSAYLNKADLYNTNLLHAKLYDTDIKGVIFTETIKCPLSNEELRLRGARR